MSSLQSTMSSADMKKYGIPTTQESLQKVGKDLNKIVDNVAKSLKENTLTYAATIATTVKGGVQGVSSKEGISNLNFSSQAALKSNKEAIMSGVKNASQGFVAGGTANTFFNIESAFDKTPVGKAIDKAIDKGATAIKKGIDYLFGGGSK
ncbi:MAG: hypothetical protein K0S47_2793 [Herbinix sp.]|jgi:phage-related protein|nr:hypothetical protein [Herbinix sp.]